VLDVGSNTVHLLVVDAHRGGHPDPMHSEKTDLRLAEHQVHGFIARMASADLAGLEGVSSARAHQLVAGRWWPGARWRHRA
jgi:exopolyphosphatase/guanosine-5'-triphosphate,3'-diphosphate pyrophosphatase